MTSTTLLILLTIFCHLNFVIARGRGGGGGGKGGHGISRSVEYTESDRIQFKIGFACFGVYTIFYIWQNRMNFRIRVCLESYLAVAFAKLSNDEAEKAKRQLVRIGVGTNKKNLCEWIDFIWYKFDLEKAE